jgi:predicted phage terminase large subunit-like protein
MIGNLKSNRDLVLNTPAAFAKWASNGRYEAYGWIKYLSTIIAQEISQGGARLLITAPPQHGKSEFFSKWLLTWFLNLRPDERVILTSYAQQYAEKWGASVRELLTHNPRSYVPIRVDTASKKRFVTEAGGGMITAGIGGPVTGEGADLFVVDDPFKNYEEAMSKRIRERNMEWFRSVATTRLQPGGSIVVMHTRWHEADMIGELAEDPRWRLINLPAIALENDLMGRSPGQALCPERYKEKDLAIIRSDVQELVWSALYQGAPAVTGGMIVRGEWIKQYDEDPDDMAKKMDELAVFADLTYEKKEENDFTVIELWGRKGLNIYLLKQIRAQMGFHDQILHLGRMFDSHPEAFHKEIEKKANGAAVIEVVQQQYPGVVANSPHTEKPARLAAVAPLYHSGNVFYPNPLKQPWVKINIDEITKMGPGGSRSKHDDTVDVATMAVAHFGRMAGSMRALEALGRR